MTKETHFNCSKCNYLFSTNTKQITFDNGELYIPPCPKCASVMHIRRELSNLLHRGMQILSKAKKLSESDPK